MRPGFCRALRVAAMKGMYNSAMKLGHLRQEQTYFLHCIPMQVSCSEVTVVVFGARRRTAFPSGLL